MNDTSIFLPLSRLFLLYLLLLLCTISIMSDSLLQQPPRQPKTPAIFISRHIPCSILSLLTFPSHFCSPSWANNNLMLPCHDDNGGGWNIYTGWSDIKVRPERAFSEIIENYINKEEEEEWKWIRKNHQFYGHSCVWGQ